MVEERVEPERPPITMKSLLEAGVHFGHQRRRWNPKMRQYIFSHRNGIHIIDLQQTLHYIERAAAFIEEIAAQGKGVTLVGTKKQAHDTITGRGRAVRSVLRQHPVAGWHPHQFQDHSKVVLTTS